MCSTLGFSVGPIVACDANRRSGRSPSWSGRQSQSRCKKCRHFLSESGRTGRPFLTHPDSAASIRLPESILGDSPAWDRRTNGRGAGQGLGSYLLLPGHRPPVRPQPRYVASGGGHESGDASIDLFNSWPAVECVEVSRGQ